MIFPRILAPKRRPRGYAILTRSNMTSNPTIKEKVVVIGGGISGVSTALFLRNSGFDVTLLEQREKLADAGTSVAPGIIHKWISPFLKPGLLYYFKTKLCPWFIGDFKYRDRMTWSDFKVPFYYDAFRASLPWNYAKNTEATVRLSTANHSLVQQLIRDLNLRVPIGWGALKVSDFRPAFLDALEESRVVHKIDPRCDARVMEKAEMLALVPALLSTHRDFAQGIFYPSSMVVNPVLLTEELARKAKEAGVDIKLSTRAFGFEVDDTSKRVVAVITEDNQRIPVDRLVIAAGMNSLPIARALYPRLALAPVIPMKSLGFSIDDQTSPRLPLATLFPSVPQLYVDTKTGKPLVLRPRGLEAFREAVDTDPNTLSPTQITEDNGVQILPPSGNYKESQFKTQQAVQRPSFFPSALEFLKEGLTLEPACAPSSDKQGALPHFDPVRFRLTVGHDTTNVDSSLPPQHVQSALSALQAVYNLPSTLFKPMIERLRAVDEALENGGNFSGRAIKEAMIQQHAKSIVKNADVSTVGQRNLNAGEPRLACHVISRDGVPLIGRTHIFQNVYLNTGHGPNPLSTAIAGGQVCAAVIREDALTKPMANLPPVDPSSQSLRYSTLKENVAPPPPVPRPSTQAAPQMSLMDKFHSTARHFFDYWFPRETKDVAPRQEVKSLVDESKANSEELDGGYNFSTQGVLGLPLAPVAEPALFAPRRLELRKQQNAPYVTSFWENWIHKKVELPNSSKEE